MRVLLIGSGGREHALALKLSESSSCDRLFISPGNPGTAQCGENVELDLGNYELLKDWLDAYSIDLVVVGPEQPLVDGLREELLEIGGLQNRVFFGPGKKGAELEGSKKFAKEFMQRHDIPTAAYAAFTKEESDEALVHLRSMKPPYVIKADGLAAGKGVIITDQLEEAQSSLKDLFEGKMGQAGNKVVLEEFLSGTEFSVFIMTDGKRFIELPEAKDYKRIGEGDTGPNTGGMGSVSPVPFYDDALREKVRERIIKPTVKGLEKEGIPYQGFIFFGLIEVDGEPFVIEYNVRMGDPETQSVMARLKGDLAQCMADLAEGRDITPLQIDERTAVSVVLVSEGYPGSYSKGQPIEVDTLPDEAKLIHAGTKLDEKANLVSNGGRVLAITAMGTDLAESRSLAYRSMEKVEMRSSAFRKDIGSDLLKSDQRSPAR